MTTVPDPPAADEPIAEHRARTVWTVWFVTLVLLAITALLGGWLIGLSPGYTVVLIGALGLGSLVWRIASRRRRIAADSLIGVAGRVLVSGLVLLVLIQGLPLGRDHSNAAVTGEPAWSSPRTRELMVAACYSCHSNEVEWPWYSNVAPMSWAVSDHVEEGREAVNFSEFATHPGEAEESIEQIREGSMPPAYYTRFGLHSEADLSDDERDELIAGLMATPGLADDDAAEGEGEADDDD